MNKTEIVKTLMEYEKQNGLEETLHYFFEKNINVRIGFSAKACDAPIEELMLSVRSYNALRRAGLTTLGDLVERLNEGGLKDVRNLGARRKFKQEFWFMALTDLAKKIKQNFSAI